MKESTAAFRRKTLQRAFSTQGSSSPIAAAAAASTRCDKELDLYQKKIDKIFRRASPSPSTGSDSKFDDVLAGVQRAKEPDDLNADSVANAHTKTTTAISSVSNDTAASVPRLSAADVFSASDDDIDNYSQPLAAVASRPVDFSLQNQAWEASVAEMTRSLTEAFSSSSDVGDGVAMRSLLFSLLSLKYVCLAGYSFLVRNNLTLLLGQHRARRLGRSRH